MTTEEAAKKLFDVAEALMDGRNEPESADKSLRMSLAGSLYLLLSATDIATHAALKRTDQARLAGDMGNALIDARERFLFRHGIKESSRA